jgi:hypothetical protein
MAFMRLWRIFLRLFQRAELLQREDIWLGAQKKV